MKSFLKEARRRKVFRVAAVYIVAAWVVIQVAGEAFEAFGIPDAALRHIWMGAFLGFPLALIFGWYYDITGQGIVHTSPADPDEQIDLSLHKSDYIILAAFTFVVVLITYPLISEISRTQPDVQPDIAVSEAPPNSIAVLPFVNMSGEDDNEYFSDGISEELLNKLAQLSELRVAARTSSFYFKDKNEPVPLIAAQLGVRTILEGSVRKVGNKVRITAQLINANDGYHLWSEHFDRELGDIFAIQDEIATKVVDALQVTLLGDDTKRLQRHPTDNFDAYNAYLLGRQKMARRTSDSLQEAIEHFNRAIELDNSYALAYVGLADTYHHLGRWGTLTNEEVIANAELATSRALELNDQLGEAYASLGNTLFRKRDRDGAEIAYKRAIELSPGYADAWQHYGILLKWGFGRADEALTMHLKALELDPLSTPINMSVAEDYHELGQYEKALKQSERVMEFDPEFPRAYTLMADLYWEVFAQVDEGARWLHKAIEIDPGNPNHARWLAMVYMDLGDRESAGYWLDHAIAMAPDQTHTRYTALLLAQYDGESEAILAAADELMKVWPNNENSLAILRDADLDAGRIDDAVMRYKEIYPQFFATDKSDMENFDYSAAIEVAHALNVAGQSDRSKVLLNKSLAAIESKPRLSYAGTGVSDVEIYTLLGDEEKALVTLRQAIDEGWRSFWRRMLISNRNLASLHDEPDYQAMVAELEAEMAEQLARVNEMKLNGELVLTR